MYLQLQELVQLSLVGNPSCETVSKSCSSAVLIRCLLAIREVTGWSGGYRAGPVPAGLSLGAAGGWRPGGVLCQGKNWVR